MFEPAGPPSLATNMLIGSSVSDDSGEFGPLALAGSNVVLLPVLAAAGVASGELRPFAFDLDAPVPELMVLDGSTVIVLLDPAV